MNGTVEIFCLYFKAQYFYTHKHLKFSKHMRNFYFLAIKKRKLKYQPVFYIIGFGIKKLKIIKHVLLKNTYLL